MTVQRERALLLGEALLAFSDYVQQHYEKKKISFHPDKLFRLKCLTEEFQLSLLGKEILRINQFMWMENETQPLLKKLEKNIEIIEDYAEKNLEDLFLFSPRIFMIKSLLMIMGEKG